MKARDVMLKDVACREDHLDIYEDMAFLRHGNNSRVACSSKHLDSRRSILIP